MTESTNVKFKNNSFNNLSYHSAKINSDELSVTPVKSLIKRFESFNEKCTARYDSKIKVKRYLSLNLHNFNSSEDMSTNIPIELNKDLISKFLQLEESKSTFKTNDKETKEASTESGILQKNSSKPPFVRYKSSSYHQLSADKRSHETKNIICHKSNSLPRKKDVVQSITNFNKNPNQNDTKLSNLQMTRNSKCLSKSAPASPSSVHNTNYKRRKSYVLATQNFDYSTFIRPQPSKIDNKIKTDSYVGRTVSKFEQNVDVVDLKNSKRKNEIYENIEDLLKEYYHKKTIHSDGNIKELREKLPLEIADSLLNKFKVTSTTGNNEIMKDSINTTLVSSSSEMTKTNEKELKLPILNSDNYQPKLPEASNFPLIQTSCKNKQADGSEKRFSSKEEVEYKPSDTLTLVYHEDNNKPNFSSKKENNFSTKENIYSNLENKSDSNDCITIVYHNTYDTTENEFITSNKIETHENQKETDENNIDLDYVIIINDTSGKNETSVDNFSVAISDLANETKNENSVLTSQKEIKEIEDDLLFTIQSLNEISLEDSKHVDLSDDKDYKLNFDMGYDSNETEYLQTKPLFQSQQEESANNFSKRRSSYLFSSISTTYSDSSEISNGRFSQFNVQPFQRRSIALGEKKKEDYSYNFHSNRYSFTSNSTTTKGSEVDSVNNMCSSSYIKNKEIDKQNVSLIKSDSFSSTRSEDTPRPSGLYSNFRPSTISKSKIDNNNNSCCKEKEQEIMDTPLNISDEAQNQNAFSKNEEPFLHEEPSSFEELSVYDEPPLYKEPSLYEEITEAYNATFDSNKDIYTKKWVDSSDRNAKNEHIYESLFEVALPETEEHIYEQLKQKEHYSKPEVNSNMYETLRQEIKSPYEKTESEDFTTNRSSRENKILKSCTIYDEDNNPTIRLSMYEMLKDVNYEDELKKIEEEHKIIESEKEFQKNILDIQNNTKKSYLMAELVSTEISYINKSLYRLVFDYMSEMKRSDLPLQLMGKGRYIFGNADILYEKHKNKFLPDLHQCTSFEDVANCFLKHESLFKLYPLYSKNKPKSEMLMQDFGIRFFKEKQKELNDRLDLSSYLLTPIQRIAKYCQIVNSLIKECEKERLSTEKLKKALDMLQKQMRAGNDLIAVDSVLHYDGNIKEQGDLLLRDKFFVTAPNRRVFEGMVFLFQNSIMITSIILQNGMELFEYRDNFLLNDMGYTNNESEPLVIKIWYRKRDQKQYVLRANNKELQQKWVKELFNLLWKQLEANKTQKKKEMEQIGMKMTRVPVIRPISVPNTEKYQRRDSTKSRSSTLKKSKSKSENSSSVWYLLK